MPGPIKVLVVDDTAIYRRILSDAIEAIAGAELSGTAPNGAIALQKMRQKPVDLVLLDIFMPEMDGVETLEHIRKEWPKVHVIMISGATTRDASITIRALKMGAADFIPKPQARSFSESMPIITQSIQQVLTNLHLVQVPQKKPIKLPEPEKSSPPRKLSSAPTNFELVVIGVSTGGPKTLGQIIPKLPADLRAPILIVQHMPPMFTASLAEHLDRESQLNVREAQEGDAVRPGEVLIAPGGRHMVIARNTGGPSTHKVTLNDAAPVNSCRPAVDVLFASVASNVQGNVLAIILTGMGEDGAAGVAALKQKRAWCLSQSKESCVVYGMPQAIENRNLADEVVPADRMAERIIRLVNR